MQSSSHVNIVVWAETRERAVAVAQGLTGASDVNDVWVVDHEGTQVRVYVRNAGGLATATPQGITDALLVDVSGSESEFLEQARQYVNTRKGIPFKFVSSVEDLTGLATELAAEYVNGNEVATVETRTRVVTAVLALEETLRTAFSALDLNGNGLISAEELVQASSTLGHQLNVEEAKTVANTLSTDGNINFAQFKSWWVLGRGDFNTFRRVVQVEMKVGGLLKQGSEQFNNYLQRLQTDTTTGETLFNGRVNISPVNDFETGFGVTVELTAGKDFDNLVNASPDYYRVSPFTGGVEIRVNSEAAGASLLQTLEGLKALSAMIPPVQEALSSGVVINLRHVGTSVFVEVSLSGMFADMAQENISMFNFEKLNFAGTGNVSFHTGVRLNDLLTGTVSDLLARAVLVKLESHSELTNTHVLFNGISAMYETARSVLPREVRELFLFVKFLGAVRNFGYEFRYDNQELTNILTEALGVYGSSALNVESTEVVGGLNMQLQGVQGMGMGMLEQFKPMVDAVLLPYKPVLAAVNFDRISVFASNPNFRLYNKISLQLPGVTEFVNAQVLN